MTTTDRLIEVHIRHMGVFEFTPRAMDRVIEQHLPNSVEGLRRVVAEDRFEGVDGGALPDVSTVFELLAMLADHETARLQAAAEAEAATQSSTDEVRLAKRVDELSAGDRISVDHGAVATVIARRNVGVDLVGGSRLYEVTFVTDTDEPQSQTVAGSALVVLIGAGEDG